MIRFTESAAECTRSIANALIEFASKDTTREHLNGVTVEQGNLCSTDGHTLVRFMSADPGLEASRYDRRVWPLAYVKEQARIAGSKGTVRLEWAALANDRVVAPPLKQVESFEGMGAKEAVGIDSKFLARLEVVCKAAAYYAKRIPGIVLSSLRGPLDPMRFETAPLGSGIAARVVVMPMRF